MNRIASPDAGRWFAGMHPLLADDPDPWAPVSHETLATLRDRGRPSAPEPAPRLADAAPLSRRGPALALSNQAFAQLCIGVAAEPFAALDRAYRALRLQPNFLADYARHLSRLLSRPTMLQCAVALGGAFSRSARIFLKREDLRQVSVETEHATSHAYVASKLGVRTLVAPADVEAHAVAAAVAARHFDLACVVVMPAADLEHRAPLIERLQSLGAHVEDPSTLEAATADPREPALRYWKASPDERWFAPALGVGPAPYSAIAADAMALIGHETELQLRARAEGTRSRTFVAARHSEADCIGFLLPHLVRSDAELIYAEPEPAAAGRRSRRLAAYDGLPREHAELRATGRITYLPIRDLEAAEAGRLALEKEGVVVGAEDARALAAAQRLAARDTQPRDIVVLVA